jgi:hypothetical protein
MLNYTNRTETIEHFKRIEKNYNSPLIVIPTFYENKNFLLFKSNFIQVRFSKEIQDLDLFEIQLLKVDIKKTFLLSKKELANGNFDKIMNEFKFPNHNYIFTYFKDYLVLNPVTKKLLVDIRLRDFRDIRKNEYLPDFREECLEFLNMQIVSFTSIFKL